MAEGGEDRVGTVRGREGVKAMAGSRRKGLVRERFREEGGFTLAELLVVIVIMSLFLFAVGNMISSGVRGSSTSYSLVKVQEAGGEAVNFMVRQLRGAMAISPGSTSSSVIFAADLDGDDKLEEACFDLADGYLRRGQGAKGSGNIQMQNWVEGCSSLEFRYWVYDAKSFTLREWDPSLIGDHLNIRRIDVSITLFREALGGSGPERAFTGSVTLRNSLQDLF